MQFQYLANVVSTYAPEPVKPAIVQLARDLRDLLFQQPTAEGLERLGVRVPFTIRDTLIPGAGDEELILLFYVQLIYYAFFTKPSPAFGVVDFYILNPIDSLLRRKYKVSDLTLRERLGGGNYGQASSRVSLQVALSIGQPVSAR